MWLVLSSVASADCTADRCGFPVETVETREILPVTDAVPANTEIATFALG